MIDWLQLREIIVGVKLFTIKPNKHYFLNSCFVSVLSKTVQVVVIEESSVFMFFLLLF